MNIPLGTILFLCPCGGSTATNNGLLIANDGEVLRVHILHSRESAVRLLERYEPITDPLNKRPWRGTVDGWAIPETSFIEDVCVEGLLAMVILGAFADASAAGELVSVRMLDTPRLLAFAHSADGQEALCIWCDAQGHHVAHLMSLEDVKSTSLKLAKILDVRARKRLLDMVRLVGMPAASARPSVIFHGAAAAMIGDVFEKRQRRERRS